MERTPVTDDQDNSASWLRRELLAIVREEVGLVGTFAEPFADALLVGIRRRMGGREVYIPAPDKAGRDEQIRAMFNGRNLTEVMRQFGVCKKTVYRACQFDSK
jgi:Mor family transcriptional regulator